MKGYRTIGFNILMAVIPVLELYKEDLGLTPKQHAFVVLFLIIGNIILRFKTDTRVFHRRR